MKNYVNEDVEFIGCPGCAYANHEFIIPCGIAYENDNFTVSQDWELPIIGFFVVAPKRHVEKLEELTSSEKIEMFEIVDKTIRILRHNKICDKFNIIFEEKEGSHFHIWIMPRHKWMEELAAGITKNIGDVFNYAKNNMRIKCVYDEIDKITKIVAYEFNK